MSVEEVMNPKIVKVSPEDTIITAAKAMAKSNIGSVMVYLKDRPAGILTERDVLNKVVAAGLDSRKVLVKDIMTKKLITIDSDAPLTEANDLMTKNKIRRLPVTKGAEIVGILTVRDIAEHLPNQIARQLKLDDSSDLFP